MKRTTFALKLFFAASLFCAPLFAEKSVQDVLKSFDEALMQKGIGSANAVIGKITYSDTDVCGTVAPYFKQEIENAAQNTRRIKIISSSKASDATQVIAATRSLSAGMLRPPKNNSSVKDCVIDGRYKENGSNIELELTLFDQDGKTLKSETAFFSRDKIEGERLTLYPANLNTQKLIDKDFAVAVQKTSNEMIKISAVMLDADQNQVEILHPGDSVKFIIQTSADAYIALQGIDATGDVYWLPIEDCFIPKEKKRVFPDISDTEFKVMDGVFGAESIIIHAFSTKEALESQIKMVEGSYRSGTIGMTRSIGAVKKTSSGGGNNAATGMFKIVYTVVE